MNYIDAQYVPHFPGGDNDSLYDYLNNIVRGLKSVGPLGFVQLDNSDASSEMSQRERRLLEIQTAISSVSMHLQTGFSHGLSRQFYELLDEDAWEDEDVLPDMSSVRTFLQVLVGTDGNRRPGIGTNGRGSVTAFWLADGNRLTVECLPEERITWVLTRELDGETVRAAGESRPARLLHELTPYNPEIWFD